MAGGHSTKTILVAEDADPDFLFLKRAFALAGYAHALVHARNGLEAMQYLEGVPPYEDRVQYPFPDLVILDAKMPKGSGMDVLKAARERQLSVPIVMLSGSGGPGDADLTLDCGAAEYLRKPDEIAELVTLAQAIHHRWLAGA